MQDNDTLEVSREQIATCAYIIWEHEGLPAGMATEHWRQAELQLQAASVHERWLTGVQSVQIQTPV